MEKQRKDNENMPRIREGRGDKEEKEQEDDDDLKEEEEKPLSWRRRREGKKDE